jgi:hypothetical protein
MNSARLFVHNPRRLMMLRHKRRSALNWVMLWAGLTCFAASIAFLVGRFSGGAA